MDGQRAAGWALLVILGAGFLLGLAGLFAPAASAGGAAGGPADAAGGEGTPARAAVPPDGAALLSGEWAAGWQRAYERRLPLRPLAVRGWDALRYALFREGRPGVLVGADGWLFTTEEFAAAAAEEAALERAAAAVAAVRDRLRGGGSGLVVALVPAKARLYPDRLGRYRFPGVAADRYGRFREALAARGIEAPDLAAALGEARAGGEVFLRTDTHWSPRGARAAAAALAGPGRRELAARGVAPTGWRTWRTGTRVWRGDLLRFLPPGPAPEGVAEEQTGEENPQRLGLFDEVAIPVTLVGTSYSSAPLWNFEGALKEALGADVLNAAEEGRGPLAPMRAWLESEAARTHPPALVIWEIPERLIASLAEG